MTERAHRDECASKCLCRRQPARGVRVCVCVCVCACVCVCGRDSQLNTSKLTHARQRPLADTHSFFIHIRVHAYGYARTHAIFVPHTYTFTCLLTHSLTQSQTRTHHTVEHTHTLTRLLTRSHNHKHARSTQSNTRAHPLAN
jgi:hypothetical protein